jgi:hypothetical protein
MTQYCRNAECGFEGDAGKGSACPECGRMSLTVQPPRTFLETANLKLLDEFAEYASRPELKDTARQFIAERRVR